MYHAETQASGIRSSTPQRAASAAFVRTTGVLMKRRNLILATPALLAGGLLPIGLSRASQPQVVRFGQSASLTGGQAAYGRDVRDGILAAFTAASQAGGPRFELVTLDDGGVKERCAQNVGSLIQGGVSALIGLTSGAAAEACLPLIAQNRIAMLGTASGNLAIRGEATHSAAFHVRAGYDLEYQRMAFYIKDFGLRRVGAVYLQDAPQLNLDAMNQALSGFSIAPKEVIAVDRNARTFDSVAQQLVAAKLDCVLFATNAGPATQIIEGMTAAGYRGLFYASSFAGQDLVDSLVEKKRSCIMSMVVPRPSAMSVNVVNKCGQDLAASNGKAKLGMTTLEGYIAGRIAIEATRSALRASGDNLTRMRLKDALAGLRTDLGGYKVDFASGTSQGSRYVDLIAVDRNGRLIG
jgi:ABC-type branched-subunit amino acid transport system substrate-binding protein